MRGRSGCADHQDNHDGLRRRRRDTVERINYRECLTPVRAFYLDLAHWAVEDPARWAPWVAPCPVGDEEINRKKAQAPPQGPHGRPHPRTAAGPAGAGPQPRSTTQQRRTAARGSPQHAQPEAGQLHRRQRTRSKVDPRTSAEPESGSSDPATGKRRDLTPRGRARVLGLGVVEVLRATGIRVEELIELSHHSLVQYRLPDTGELVPLLQIAPSKTDAERLLVVSPDLADVLATIISRVRRPPGRCRWSRLRQPRAHLVAAGPVAVPAQHPGGEPGDPDRRDRQNAPRGAGRSRPDRPIHRSATALHAPRLPAHVHHRRDPQRAAPAHRPGHRWPPRHQRHHGLQGRLPRGGHPSPPGVPGPPPRAASQRGIPHPHRRGVGGVPRPLRNGARSPSAPAPAHIGTACIHEHACVRCSLLWPDPAQRDRLVEIRDNLHARIAEAEREGWLGEVEGLQISLAGAKDKLAQIDQRPTTINLGMPAAPPHT